MKKTSKEITNILAKEITMGKYEKNTKLPSENALSIKYQVSRAITNKVFSNLKEMDLVYSVPHKGYFVAEFFSGITEPYYYKYKINKVIHDKKNISSFFKKVLQDKNVKIEKNIRIKKLFSDDEEIIFSEIWILKSIRNAESFNQNFSLTDSLSNLKLLKSVSIIGKFENDNYFKNQLQFVEYKYFFGKNELLAITRNLIKHEKATYSKKEKPI